MFSLMPVMSVPVAKDSNAAQDFLNNMGKLEQESRILLALLSRSVDPETAREGNPGTGESIGSFVHVPSSGAADLIQVTTAACPQQLPSTKKCKEVSILFNPGVPLSIPSDAQCLLSTPIPASTRKRGRSEEDSPQSGKTPLPAEGGLSAEFSPPQSTPAGSPAGVSVGAAFPGNSLTASPRNPAKFAAAGLWLSPGNGLEPGEIAPDVRTPVEKFGTEAAAAARRARAKGRHPVDGRSLELENCSLKEENRRLKLANERLRRELEVAQAQQTPAKGEGASGHAERGATAARSHEDLGKLFDTLQKSGEMGPGNWRKASEDAIRKIPSIANPEVPVSFKSELASDLGTAATYRMESVTVNVRAV